MAFPSSRAGPCAIDEAIQKCLHPSVNLVDLTRLCLVIESNTTQCVEEEARRRRR